MPGTDLNGRTTSECGDLQQGDSVSVQNGKLGDLQGFPQRLG